MKYTIQLFLLLLFFGYNQKVDAQKNNSSDQEVIDLALKISNELYQGNYAFYDNLFFQDSFVNRVTIDDGSRDLRKFNQGFKEGFTKEFTWGKEFYSLVSQGALYEPVGFNIAGASAYITFSMFSNSGLNYHELELKKVNGKYRIMDVFVYSNGELLSETIKLLYLGGLEADAVASKLTGKSKKYMKEVESILDFHTLVKAGEWDKLNTFLDQTSAAFQATKYYYNFKSKALVNSGKMKEYYTFLKANSSAAIPASYLTNLDVYTIDKDFASLQDNINSLDKFVGGDPALNSFRGNGFLNAGDFVNARKSFQLLYDDFPDYSYGLIGLLSVGLESGNAVLSVNSFADLHDRFGFTKADIMKIADPYPAVGNSGEFKKYVGGL